jgi:hypothetical protein
LPINQLAANKLRMAGVAADPSMLAVFQLMRWGLDNDVPLTHRRAATELERLCRDPAPGKVLDYLVENIPGGDDGTVPHFGSPHPPTRRAAAPRRARHAAEGRPR